jgi:3-mercaptopyruvate sulfurtransferase SseA
MKKVLSLPTFLAIALLVSTACQSVSTSSADNKTNKPANSAAPKTDDHGHADDAPRITLADAKKEFDAGNVVFIDTRAKAAYDAEHIKGSINMTTSDVETRYKEIPPNKKIIAYCS